MTDIVLFFYITRQPLFGLVQSDSAIVWMHVLRLITPSYCFAAISVVVHSSAFALHDCDALFVGMPRSPAHLVSGHKLSSLLES